VIYVSGFSFEDQIKISTGSFTWVT